MKHMNSLISRKNLTRFDYETATFQGWRLSLIHKGSQFCRYFPDKHFGSGRKSLSAATTALATVREILDRAKLEEGKHTQATCRKVQKVLDDAVK